MGATFGGLVAALLGVACVSGSAPVADDSVRAQLDAASTEAKLFGFARAHEMAEAALNRTRPPSAEWQRAAFLTGLCAHQASPPTPALIRRAATLYELLLSTAPDSKYAGRAMMQRGRIEEMIDFYGDSPNLDFARQWYARVVERWPNDPVAGEATLRIACTHFQTFEGAQIAEGITVLEAWVAQHPEDALASGMWQVLGDVYFYPLGQFRRSLECYEEAERLGLLETGREGPIYWRMAVLADRFLDDHPRAVTYYTHIIERTPSSGKAYEAQLALRRLGAPVPKIKIYARTSDERPSRDRVDVSTR